MCGIAGSINHKLLTKKVINLLKHRGPDGWGEFLEKNVHFLHTRLAIQDLKQGKQPYSWRNLVLVFNGEIYNHIELREKYLIEYRFKTQSDAETLLYLYHKFKKNLFNFIDGMYAFAIYDKEKNSLFLARDRSGKKPLYYFVEGNKFVFASELNVLKQVLNLSIDYEALEFFFRVGFFWKNTPYRKVFELDPGSYLIVDTKSGRILEYKKYFYIEDIYFKNKNYNLHNINEAVNYLEYSLSKAVYNRLISSDVEVGAFLSGGIDSSLIVAMACKYKSIKAYTVKFEGLYDESSIAKKISTHLGIEHTIIEIDFGDLENNIEKILTSYGKPFSDSSAIPSYYISKEASKFLKVILNGDGGDELFGGYRRYVPFQFSWIKNLKFLRTFIKVLPKPKEKTSKYNFIHRLFRLLNKNGLNFYLSFTTDIFEDVFSEWNANNHYFKNLDNFINNILNLPNLDLIQKLLILDFNILLPADLLQKMDIATMQNSLEARSPFLSIYLIEAASKISSNLKIKGFTTKYILRKIAEKYLPREIIKQPKRGFEVPLIRWVDKNLKDIIIDYVLIYPQWYTYFIPKKFIEKIYERKIPIAEDKRAKIIWNLFSLEVWGQNL